ncbi:MAG: adenylate/guanylate cyclase domain-containing protein [Candidatus Eremiobacterota bacterium]
MDREASLRGLNEAIRLQESLRGLLGDPLVDPVIRQLREQLQRLDGAAALPPVERKVVSILFCDLSGFTAMSEKADPEQVRATLSACFDRLVKVIHRFEGTVEKFIGDAIVAIFGAPVAHEDDPERAGRTALELLAELQRFNADQGLALGMHVGINTGLVVAGEIRAQGQSQYAVTGDTVNLAARLEGHSETGQILVGPTTYRLTRQAFRYRPLGGVRFKGKAAPVPVYQLLGLEESGRGRLGTALVGRDRELELVLDHLERLRDGRGGVLRVMGDAGIGKTRLATEARQRAPEGLAWWVGDCRADSEPVRYAPLVALLQEHRSVLEVLPPDLATPLASLAGVATPDEEQALAALEPEGLKALIFRSLWNLFARLCERQPHVLLLDNLHWSDPSTRDLLEHLEELTREAPLLLLLLSRPGALHDSEVALEPLDEASASLMLEQLLGLEDPALAGALHRRAGGNPLFLEELARALTDSGAVRWVAGRWERVKPVSEIGLPDTLQGLVQARFDRLPPDQRELLRAASVIGQEFSASLLERMLGAPAGEVPAGFMEPDGEGALRFRHALEREVVYASISLADRRGYHRRLGDLLEQQDAAGPQRLGWLAYHYAEAGEWEKAQRYLFQVADLAGEVGADAEALSTYRRAADAYGRAFGGRWDPLDRARLQRKLGEAHLRRGELEAARQHFRQARACLRAPNLDSSAAVRWSLLRELPGHLAFLFGPRRHHPADPRVEERLSLNQAQAFLEFVEDQERFLVLTLEGQNLARRAGRPQQASTSLAGIGMGCALGGLARLSRFYLRKAAELSDGRPLTDCVVELGWGIHASMYARPEQALAHFSRSAELARGAGDWESWSSGAIESSEMLYVMGRLAESLAVGEEMVRLGQESGLARAECLGLTAVGRVRLWLDGPAAALDSLERSHAMALVLDDRFSLPKVAAHLVEACLAAERLDQARTVVARTEKQTRGRRLMSHLAGWYDCARAQIHLVEALQEPGPDAWRRLERSARAAVASSRRSNGCLAWAIYLEGCLDWHRGATGRARQRWAAALAEAERIGAGLMTATIRFERGRLEGIPDRQPLEELTRRPTTAS